MRYPQHCLLLVHVKPSSTHVWGAASAQLLSLQLPEQQVVLLVHGCPMCWHASGSAHMKRGWQKPEQQVELAAAQGALSHLQVWLQTVAVHVPEQQLQPRGEGRRRKGDGVEGF